MAFATKIGNLLKQSASSNPSLFQSIRCMSSSKVFVGGLSYGTDDMGLKDAFSYHGEVVEARVIIDRESGRSRGFGFVTFASTENAQAAITAMDGKDLHGRMVRVNYANDRAGGFRGGAGGSGGFGGGSGGFGGGSGGFDGGFGGGSGGYGGGSGGYGGGSGSYGGGSGSYGGSQRGYGGGRGGGNGMDGMGGNFGGNEGGLGGSDDLIGDKFDLDDEASDFASKRG